MDSTPLIVANGGVFAASALTPGFAPTSDQYVVGIAQMLQGWFRAGAPVRVTGYPRSNLDPNEGQAPDGKFPCVNLVDGSYPGTRVPLYNACTECRTAVMVWTSGRTTRHSVAGKSTLWIEIAGPSGRQVDDASCGRGVAADDIAVSAEPDENTKQIVQLVLDGGGGADPIYRASIVQPIVDLLDQYATALAGRECKVNAVYGCGSCCNDNKRANLVHTTCGWQCWTCANDSCS